MQELDLSRLAAFAAVAEHRSFRGAATARGLSASTLSLAVRELETSLGVRLLNRTTRSVAPTQAGSALLARLKPTLADLAAMLDEVRSEASEPAGTVRINAPQPAIDLVLAPIVTAFLADYPKVRLEIIAETSLIDIVQEGFDAGVRWGEDLAQDMVAVPIGRPQRYAIVAAPGLVAALGAPADPQDLMRYPALRQRFPNGSTPLWELERDGEIVRLDPQPRLVSSSIQLHRRAALEGIGAWAIFEDYVIDDIQAGRLVRLLPDWCPDFPGPFLYHPSRRQVRPALRAFIDFAKGFGRLAEGLEVRPLP